MQNNPFRKWEIAVCGFICLLGLFVGGSLYIAPAKFIPGVDFSSPAVGTLTDMWAARQIAIAAIIGFSLWRKSVAMLQVSLVAYFLMTFQDIFIGAARSDVGLMAGSAFFCAVSVLLLWNLARRSAPSSQRT
ncbi:MAG: hypothetical protein ACRD5G_01845 [Candidatus Acidiferrales bacterium]